MGDIASHLVLDTCRPVYSMLEKNKTVTKFLNRMLAMSLRDQKLLFTYFNDTLVSLLAHSCIKLAHYQFWLCVMHCGYCCYRVVNACLLCDVMLWPWQPGGALGTAAPVTSPMA